MKYLKKYEEHTIKNIDDAKFKVGDYVKLKPHVGNIENIKIFLNNNIGQIIDIELNKWSKLRRGKEYYFYNIKYYNVPDDIVKYTRFMGSFPENGLKQKGEIFTESDESYMRLATPEEIKDLIIKQTSNKYNL